MKLLAAPATSLSSGIMVTIELEKKLLTALHLQSIIPIQGQLIPLGWNTLQKYIMSLLQQ
jgi:hypothetical protein